MAEYTYNYFEAVVGNLTGKIGVEPFDPGGPRHHRAHHPDRQPAGAAGGVGTGR
ncbi:hypothetical protein Voc01_066200 [Virgisporangium ochraceum]|uniref:Uncharacterized protein n=1 Tax=Virgisporangium ochraceum TaxID=65505 RepID=A0A8J3ZYQ5_9ACTN|nr:hypothetical protein Voc01_066200 [Virgisporangium ochraceum]